ncbi:unnamed protein product [Phytophthora fragariaefolia]|uniref:Unnamed protein product n=1 Tax=Phytophthora fragariaefolia TaxID=1490495 RepID=A0A9W6WRT5_9STRA|nr:unnamed protein product [Phytophthora fragariaefolia]
MRLQYVALVAAAALAASTDGLQIAPNSVKATSLRAPTEIRYPPYVEGKGERFLISEVNKESDTPNQSGYEFSALQEEDDVLQQDGNEYDEDSDSDSGSSDTSHSEERAKKRRWGKKKKKHKETETPTPTPTPTPGGTGTPTPSPTPAPTPTPRALKKFVSWFKRVFGD